MKYIKSIKDAFCSPWRPHLSSWQVYYHQQEGVSDKWAEIEMNLQGHAARKGKRIIEIEDWKKAWKQYQNLKVVELQIKRVISLHTHVKPINSIDIITC